MRRLPPPAFRDRTAAGRALAERLHTYRGRDVVVLALPRGGVPVALPVARALHAPLDVVLVRKLGLPGQPELAMGAVAGVDGGVELVRNEVLLRRAAVAEDAFDEVRVAEVAELRRREDVYREDREAVPVAGRAVVLVDDGLATGSTALAAVSALRRRQPSRLCVAVPVGSAAACAAVRTQVDDLVCPVVPEPFVAVGQAYADFGQVDEDEVRVALRAGAG